MALPNFLLNPYEADLNLNDKDDRKLFSEASKGLKEGNLFDGKRETFSTFSKLIVDHFFSAIGHLVATQYL